MGHKFFFLFSGALIHIYEHIESSDGMKLKDKSIIIIIICYMFACMCRDIDKSNLEIFFICLFLYISILNIEILLLIMKGIYLNNSLPEQ